MTYLLDTNVVSELRRAKPHGAVLAWLATVDDRDLHISAVTIGEIQAGVERTRARDPRRADEIDAWLDRIVATFDILPMDTRAFRHWSILMHGRSDDRIEDAMIAATAAVNNLVVVTRNVMDFRDLDVRIINPFARPE